MYYSWLKFFNAAFLALLIATTAAAQSKEYLDSLEAKLETLKGAERFQICYDLAYDYWLTDRAKALHYGEEANKWALMSGDTLKITRGKLAYGNVLCGLERIDDAIRELEISLTLARRHQFRHEMKYILNVIARAYQARANYEKALEYYYQTLLIREEGGKPDEISIALTNIGVVLYKLGNYHESIKYFLRAIEMKRQFKIKHDLDLALVNIGSCYIYIGQYEQAKQVIAEGLAECRPNCRYSIIIDAHHALGKMFLRQFTADPENFQARDSAEAHLMFSYNLSLESNYVLTQLDNLSRLGDLYLNANDIPRAFKVLNRADSLSATTSYNERKMDIYHGLAELYQKTADFEKASHYQRKFMALQDTLVRKKLHEIVATSTNIHERENLQTIANKESIIQRQQSLNIAIIIIAILTALLLIVVYRNNRIKARVNAALSEAKAIIELQNRQLLNSNIYLDRELKERNADLEKANESLIKANDELDNFIYRTSHDIRGPLATLKGMCHVALLDVKDPLAQNYLQKLDLTADKMNMILTRLLVVNQIHASSIASQKINFEELVDEIVALQTKKGLPQNMSITKQIDQTIEFFSDREFIRIILENLIDNAVKFYNATEGVEPFVRVEITRQGATLLIRVIDNGIGIRNIQPGKIFQMFSRGSERSQTGGIGLYITKTAVEKLHGDITLDVTREGFTQFSVILPLSNIAVAV